MKRLCAVLMAVIAIVGVNSLAIAQGMEPPQDMTQPMGKGMQMGMGQGKMMQKSPMHDMMMKAMMEKSMVATPDGGVIVLAGNKLLKYDQDLNLVKEVEIKIDVQSVRKCMMDMMTECPMMKDQRKAAEDSVAQPEEKGKE